MTILEKIKEHKIKEIIEKKELYPVKLLERSVYFNTECVSLKKYIKDPERSGIIAEFKRKSPSKGFINKYADVESISIGYMQAGASALSIITDEYFFGAKKSDIEIARKFNYCPILRKDFIIDDYQVIEAKSKGADTILLIAKMLKPTEIKGLAKLAKNLGMEILLEIHEKEELDDICIEDVDIVGVNNRNLNTFDVDIQKSIELSSFMPENIIKIAESGIESAENIKLLKENGFDGFLIGEYFMKHSDPAEKCKELVKQISKLSTEYKI